MNRITFANLLFAVLASTTAIPAFSQGTDNIETAKTAICHALHLNATVIIGGCPGGLTMYSPPNGDNAVFSFKADSLVAHPGNDAPVIQKFWRHFIHFDIHNKSVEFEGCEIKTRESSSCD